tara:strand:- start:290 stop:577 length:288 start_codon:yes stop_codon:yes gene_type:complete
MANYRCVQSAILVYRAGLYNIRFPNHRTEAPTSGAHPISIFFYAKHDRTRFRDHDHAFLISMSPGQSNARIALYPHPMIGLLPTKHAIFYSSLLD